jgi:hypothetical protein
LAYLNVVLFFIPQSRHVTKYGLDNRCIKKKTIILFYCDILSVCLSRTCLTTRYGLQLFLYNAVKLLKFLCSVEQSERSDFVCVQKLLAHENLCRLSSNRIEIQ